MTDHDERLYLEDLIADASEWTIINGAGPEAESIADGLEMIVQQRLAKLTPPDLPMTPEQRDKLINDYADRFVDDMDVYDICKALVKSIAHDLETESDEYVIEKVKEFYPDLLED